MWPWENGVRSLFSAHAEVIPGYVIRDGKITTLLRACGGNSFSNGFDSTPQISSPRMRR